MNEDREGKFKFKIEQDMEAGFLRERVHFSFLYSNPTNKARISYPGQNIPFPLSQSCTSFKNDNSSNKHKEKRTSKFTHCIPST